MESIRNEAAQLGDVNTIGAYPVVERDMTLFRRFFLLQNILLSLVILAVWTVPAAALQLAFDGSVLDNTVQTFTTGGNVAWIGQTEISVSGGSAARIDGDLADFQCGDGSGPPPLVRPGGLTDGQSGWLQTTVTGPGTIEFTWKVSSEKNYDFLTFAIDGVDQPDAISGQVGWQQKTYVIPTGTHTLRWTYSKDGSCSDNTDQAWLDKVVYTPLPAIAMNITQTYQTQWGSLGAGDGQFNNPNGVAVDTSGNVFVTDFLPGDGSSSNNRIQKFDSNGQYLAKFEGTSDLTRGLSLRGHR